MNTSFNTKEVLIKQCVLGFILILLQTMLGVGTDIIGRAIEVRPLDALDDNIKKSYLIKSSNVLEGVNKRYLSKTIKARVKLDLQECEKNLQARRKRLKILLNNEDNGLNDELKKRAVVMIEKRRIEEKERSEEVDKIKSKEEEEYLAKKILELDMSKCKEVKTILANRREVETKAMQQFQMKQKEMIKLKEKEENNMWHKIMLRDAESRKKIEEERIEKIQRDEMARRAFLDSQVKLSHELKRNKLIHEKEAELKQCAYLTQRLNQADSEEKERMKNNKAILGRDLIKQVNLMKNQELQSKMEVHTLENSLIEKSMNEKKSDEMKKLLNKKNERKQIDFFNQHLINIKNSKEQREKQIESTINDDADKLTTKIEQERVLLNKKRITFLKDIIKERNSQMEERKRLMQLQSQEAELEKINRIKTENKNKELEQFEKQQLANLKKSYNDFLKDQMKDVIISKEMELEKEKFNHQKKMMEEKQKSEKYVEILNREFETESTHPFKLLMKKDKQISSVWYPFIPETKYFKY